MYVNQHESLSIVESEVNYGLPLGYQ